MKNKTKSICHTEFSSASIIATNRCDIVSDKNDKTQHFLKKACNFIIFSLSCSMIL